MSKLNFDDFYREVENQLNYLRNGATSYRIETAEIALQFLNHYNDMSIMLNRDELEKNLKINKPEIDAERMKDVAKFLSVIAGRMNLDLKLPEEMKKLLQERKQRRKGYELIPQS